MSASRYRLIRPLGSGQFTAGVYLAQHVDLGRDVAIKLLERRLVTDRDELLDEARTMAALETHDNVVQVIDAGDWDVDHVYIATEVCRGGTLEALCGATPYGLDPGQACRLVSDACRGLDFMHRQGLLHLDIRPANILIERDVPKIADFGLARWVGDAAVPMVYTPHAAPEMLRDYDGSPAADQYAMAMTLAHLLTNGDVCVMPPVANTRSAWKGYPRLDTLGLNVPDRLKRVIRRATTYDPSARYKDVEGFKRGVDGAAPATSFSKVGLGALSTHDASWSIEWRGTRSGFTVEVRQNGRRKSQYTRKGVQEAVALRHVQSVVTELAYPK